MQHRKLSSFRWGRRIRLPFLFPVTLLLAATPETWTDPETHLTWATADNGSGVTYRQAEYYCGHQQLGGHNEWAVPTVEELRGLFGGQANSHGYHVNGPIDLTGWAWSSSPGKQSGEMWVLDFGDGGRASVVMGDSGLNRALCVRRTR